MKTDYRILFETLINLTKERISLEESINKASTTTGLLVADSSVIIRDYLRAEGLLNHNSKIRQPEQKENIGGGLYVTHDIIQKDNIPDNITEKCKELIKNNTLVNYLKRRKTFLYVGHSDWGKSFTLKHITDNDSRKKVIKIYNKTFRVRKMSNDDDEMKLLEFVNNIRTTHYQYYIIAFCPRQLESQRTSEILNVLRSFSDLFFFVQKKQYNTEKLISENEIQSLHDYGTVFTLEEEFEYKERAEKLLDFIGQNL